ncbi:MAG: hypothetical protein H7249_05630 [Chitinophagaceae bacterium]|nr:hypothetical protein [Oligoflexus sp.]
MTENKQIKDVIRPYMVDGIQEYDNPLPPWWVWMFVLCIAFGFIYVIWVHGFGWNRLDDELHKVQLSHAAFIKEKSAPL